MSMSIASTKKEFVKKSMKVHGNEYDYSGVVYKNNYTPVTIHCSTHGSFQQLPKNHLKGVKCYKCYRQSLKYDKQTFITLARKVHGELYEYENVVYKNSQTNVEILCKIHGSFWTRPDNHINRKSGCPKCKWSIGELKIYNFLEEKRIPYVRNKTFPNCKSPRGWPLKFDFFLPSKNLLIEYDGKQHFCTSRIGYYKTTTNDLNYTRGGI